MTTTITTITAAAPDIESLVRDYYIDSSRFIYDDDYRKILTGVFGPLV